MSTLHMQQVITPIIAAVRSFRSGLLLCSILLTLSPWCLTSTAIAADKKPAMTAAELTDIVRQPNVGAKATNVQVVGAGPDVTVLAQTESASGERDLKIDAVFLAKALFQNAAGQISRVKVLFSQAGHDGRYVNITDREISEYGSGRMTPEQLLATLRLVPVEAEKAPDVVQGPQLERRLLVWQRIEKLRQQGTGVVPFETIFAEVEAAIKSGSQDPSKKLTFLEATLADQEEALKQAKRTARGLGVPASKNSLASSSPQVADRALAAGSGTQGQTQQSQYLPPQHEQIRQTYHRRVDEIINLTRAKDRSAAEEMISLKKQIETAFLQDRKPEAFALIHQFQLLAQKAAGIDMFGPGQGEGPPAGSGGGPNGGQGGGPNGGQGGGPNDGRGGGPNGGHGGGPNGGPNVGPP
jgi:hypothetical protein